jgi:chromosome segregation ATPase
MGKENPQPNRQAGDPDLTSIRAGDISFEEQVEIIGEINEVLEKNRIEIKPDTFAFTPKKRGSLIPLLINGGALVILALGAFFLLAFFNREERSLIQESTTVLSAEGKLIEALREESEQQLSEKDSQIADIQERLEDLRKQAETAKLETEARIREREEQLRGELEDQLAAEREKLRSAGLTTSAIDDQLRALQQRLTSENESRLAEFREASETELAEKAAEIAALEEQYRQSLLQFQQERSDLVEQFSEREAELRAQLAQQAEEAESVQAAVADQLAALREQRRREQLVFDQIQSAYSQVENDLAVGRYDTALRDLSNLESYLSQTSIAALPAVQDRIPTDRFLIASLRDLIEARRTPPPEAVSQLEEGPPSETDQLLASISVTVAEADRLVQTGDSAGAERLYSSAIGQIPDIQRSHTYLVEAARRAAAEGAGQDSSAALSQLQVELDRTKASLSQQTRELDQAKATISRESQQISRYEASQAQIAALRREVSTLRQRYSSLSASGASARVSQSKVLDLVDTKLQVREVLSSEPVRSQYPELYDAMEEYFDTYGKVQLQSGQEEALKDANEVLDDLLGRGSADLSAMKRSYGAAEGDPFAQFLKKLEALLE